jgi:hypothetical protein
LAWRLFLRGGFNFLPNSLLLLLWLFSSLFALLPILLILLCFFPELLGPAGNKLLNFLFLKFLLILLSHFCSLEFFRLGLPLNDLISYDIDGLLVLNSSRDVILELSGVSLAIEVGIKEHSEISE